MTYNTGPKIVTDNLRLYFDAYDKNSYPGTGTTVYDLCGNSNGTMSASSIGTTTANVFTFTGGSISFNNPLQESNLNSVFTVQAFVKMNDTGGGQRLISGLHASLWLEYSTSNDALLYLSGGANDYYTYSTGDRAFHDGVWQLATFRFKNATGERQIWKNLTKIGDGNGPNNTSTPLASSSVFYMMTDLRGQIANLMIYNRYLTDREIEQNYNATKGRFGL